MERSELSEREDEGRKIVSNSIISFCIGTYNRAERIFSLVNSILKCDRSDIEVVVADNNSTDNTFVLLHTISDLRFHYYKNRENMGNGNFVRSLTYAKGKYAFYCNDRDFILVENIPKLCDFLYQNKLAVIYCNGSFFLNKDTVYTSKYTSFINFYKPNHPTGFIFNTEYLGKIENLEWFEKKENVYDYPLMYLAGKICLMDNSAQLKNIYWKLSEKEFLLNNKSGLTPSSIPFEELWFHPRQQLKVLIQAGNYLYKNINIFSNIDSQRILYRMYINFSKSVFGFKGYMYDKYTLQHYGIKPRKITNRDLCRLYLNFYLGFKKSNLFFKFSLNYRILVIPFFNIWMFMRISLYSIELKPLLKNILKYRI
jgi:glycosyltransferase involved in cell wall biosynthesis